MKAVFGATCLIAVAAGGEIADWVTKSDDSRVCETTCYEGTWVYCQCEYECETMCKSNEADGEVEIGSWELRGSGDWAPTNTFSYAFWDDKKKYCWTDPETGYTDCEDWFCGNGCERVSFWTDDPERANPPLEQSVYLTSTETCSWRLDVDYSRFYSWEDFELYYNYWKPSSSWVSYWYECKDAVGHDYNIGRFVDMTTDLFYDPDPLFCSDSWMYIGVLEDGRTEEVKFCSQGDYKWIESAVIFGDAKPQALLATKE